MVSAGREPVAAHESERREAAFVGVVEVYEYVLHLWGKALHCGQVLSLPRFKGYYTDGSKLIYVNWSGDYDDYASRLRSDGACPVAIQ